MEIKQVIAVRKDLNLTKGKMSVQVAHASVECFRKARDITPHEANHWLLEGAKKIVVYVENKKELMELMQKIPESIPSKLIIDAGKTHLEPGTITCFGIGPAYADEIDVITKDLKLVD